MKKRMTKSLLMISAIAIAMTSLVACNTNEDDVVKVTPTPVATATADTENPTTDVPGTTDTIVDASATPDIENTPENTPNTDVTAIPNTETNPIMTPDAQTTASATVTGDTTVTPNTTVEATEKPNATEVTTAKPTSTVKPSATKAPTKKPTATATKTPTATPKKTATATKKPTATKTATPKPTATATAQKDVYQTIEFEGKTYKVLMGRNGNPNLIKDYSTLPKVLQAYAYPTFDKNAVMMDIYKYAKSVGFTKFFNPNIALKTNPIDTGLEWPDAFVPGGNMTEELALEAFSWDSPAIVNYMGDSVYTNDYGYTEVDDIIYLRESCLSTVDFLAMQEMNCLCLWIRDYGDSSYRKTYWDNGLYNGKVTKEYALYFMYGGRMSLVQEVKI